MLVIGVIVFIIICYMVGNKDSKKKAEQRSKEMKKVRSQMNKLAREMRSQGYSKEEVIFSKQYQKLNKKYISLLYLRSQNKITRK